jgi:hypothetical protein
VIANIWKNNTEDSFYHPKAAVQQSQQLEALRPFQKKNIPLLHRTESQ